MDALLLVAYTFILSLGVSTVLFMLCFCLPKLSTVLLVNTMNLEYLLSRTCSMGIGRVVILNPDSRQCTSIDELILCTKRC